MIRRRSLAAAVAAALAACTAGPEHRKPAAPVPPGWKVPAPWRQSQPADMQSKGRWWQRFGDPELDGLQLQALAGNPGLAIAAARLAQSRAALAGSSAALLPQIGATERLARQRISANRPLTNYNATNFSTVQNDLALSMTVGYEFDLAGRVQRSIEGAQASAEQAAADLQNTRLVLASDLASAYFNLRSIDTELDVVERSLELQRRALDLVSARRDLGGASGFEVAQQRALLDTTLVQIELLRRQRALFENAVATLVGTPAPQFALAPRRLDVAPPPIPLGLPSEMLERRPDIAAAERAVAAANAQIGVASAGYYPSISLGGVAGIDSRALSSLFEAPSLLWSLGLSAAQSLFDGGRVQAGVDAARAAHTAASENYRRVVLGAMQEVQDGIAGLVALERAAAQSALAVTSAERVHTLATARYNGGASAYLDVITAQQALLASERLAVQLRGQRLVTSVFLIKALGGDWQAL